MSVNDGPFYKDGLRFSCERCSRCCRVEPGFVYLSADDLTKLLDWFNLDENSFIADYCRWVAHYDGTQVLCLKETQNYDCIFWQGGGCSVYEARPLQCSTFPFWDFCIKDERSWNNAALACPGIGKGGLHRAEEIAEKAWLSRRNEPLHKEL